MRADMRQAVMRADMCQAVMRAGQRRGQYDATLCSGPHSRPGTVTVL